MDAESRKRVLVTAATGIVGREVVAQLLAAGAHVRALSRAPEEADLPRDVETMRGDLTILDDLEAPLMNIDAVFLVWTAPATTAEQVIKRIASVRRRIVYLTAPHRTPHPFFQQPNRMAEQHAKIEAMIETSGVPWTFLRPGMFAANTIAWWAAQIKSSDVVRWPYANAATAPIDERDVAAVAVHELLRSDAECNDLVVTGPESLLQRDQIRIIGEVLGRQLRFEEISPEEALRELSGPEPVIRMLLNAWAAAVGLPAYVTRTVTEVTGKPARSFREWATHNAQAFRS